jgi:hypothetical protein
MIELSKEEENTILTALYIYQLLWMCEQKTDFDIKKEQIKIADGLIQKINS